MDLAEASGFGRNDFKQLDFEIQGGAGRNLRGRSAIAVRDVGWADDTSFAAGLHELQSFLPAGNDLVQSERCGLPATHGAIEHSAVHQLSGVMNFDSIRGCWTC